MLERSVGTDPAYAPAWAALGVRYHYDAAYSTGGEASFQKSDAALERAIVLDPNFVFAPAQLITNRTETGNLAKAYNDAKALVERHPESAQAHFALAYVSRYGGAIEESAHECDTALSLDPGNFQLRSCVFTFDQLGNYAHATEFLQFDAGSSWAASNEIRHYVREGKLSQARELAQKFNNYSYGKMWLACTDAPNSANAVTLARNAAAEMLAGPDPEPRYIVASDVLFCGQRDLALNMLKSSVVTGHFCAYEGLRNDSIWAPLRGMPEFTQLLSAAKQCQSDFLAQRSQAR